MKKLEELIGSRIRVTTTGKGEPDYYEGNLAGFAGHLMMLENVKFISGGYGPRTLGVNPNPSGPHCTDDLIINTMSPTFVRFQLLS